MTPIPGTTTDATAGWSTSVQQSGTSAALGMTRHSLRIATDGDNRVEVAPSKLTALVAQQTEPGNTPMPPRSVEALDETPLVAFGVLDRQHPNTELALDWWRGLMSTGPDV